MSDEELLAQEDLKYDRRLTYDIFFDAFDRAFWAGEFKAVDWFISGLDPEQMSAEMVVGCLTMGWHARGHLTALGPFYDLALLTLTKRLGAETTYNLTKNRNPRDPATGKTG